MSCVECGLWRGWVLVGVLLGLVACAGRKVRAPEWEEGVLKMGRFFELHGADDELGAAVERGRRVLEGKGCGQCHPGGGTIGRTKEGGFPIPDLHGARGRFPRVMTPKRIVILVIVSLFVAFVVQNAQVVEVRLLFWKTEASRALVLLGTFAFGLIGGWLTRWILKKERKSSEEGSEA